MNSDVNVTAKFYVIFISFAFVHFLSTLKSESSLEKCGSGAYIETGMNKKY